MEFERSASETSKEEIANTEADSWSEYASCLQVTLSVLMGMFHIRKDRLLWAAFESQDWGPQTGRSLKKMSGL